MPVELLAPGTTNGNSTTVTVTAAAPVTVGLFAAGGGQTIIPAFTGSMHVQMQDSSGGWVFVDQLFANKPYMRLDAPGIYRVQRLGPGPGIAFSESLGVFRSDP